MSFRTLADARVYDHLRFTQPPHLRVCIGGVYPSALFRNEFETSAPPPKADTGVVALKERSLGVLQPVYCEQY